MYRTILALLTAGMLSIGLASVAFADHDPEQPLAQHCPDHEDHPGKVEATGGTQDEINELVLPEGTIFCIKAGDVATGLITADGETTLQEYLEHFGILGGDDEPRDVSYYIVYTAAPTATATATQAPTATATATQAPTATATATQAPGAVVPDTASSTWSGSLAAVLFAAMLLASLVAMGKLNMAARRKD